MQVHSCREGESALADMKSPEALQTSSDTKYFTWSAGEIEICAVNGEKIATTRAPSINMLLNFMPLL